MSDKPDEEELPEFETYEPIPYVIGDPECLILDPAEFNNEYMAIQFKDGQLWGLVRDTRRWQNVERKAGESGAIKAVRKDKPA